MSPTFENPTTFVRSIKGSPASILVAFMFVRKTMTSEELQRWTGYGDENITKGLKLLVELGWVVAHTSRGPWALADGRQLPLMPGMDLLNENENPDLIGISPIISESTLKKKKKESINLIINDSSSSSKEESRLNRDLVKTYLENSSILFGEEEVFTNGLDLDNLLPHYVLGWLAQAYSQRRRPEYPTGLNDPARVVYLRLKDVECPKPASKYYVNPLKYLPDEYLEVLGMVDYACASCDQVFKRKADLENHQKDMISCSECDQRFHEKEKYDQHVEKQHVVEEVIPQEVLGSAHPGFKLWSAIKSRLENEIAKAPFQTWIADTQVIMYDERELEILVRNSYGKEWIQSRLQTRIEQLLHEIQGQHIKFDIQIARGGPNE